MSVLTLGVNGSRDLFLDRQGSLTVKMDQDAMSDFLTQRLSTLIGECRYDKAHGLPYMTTVFQTGIDGIAPLSAAMQDALNNSTGVVSVAGIKMNIPSEGELNFVAGTVTEYGVVLTGNNQ